MQSVNSPWKENIGIYSASCVLLRPDKLKAVVRKVFGSEKVPLANRNWLHSMSVCLWTLVNRTHALYVSTCVLCLAVSRYQDSLHLVGQGFVLRGHSVGLRGDGLLLGLTVGLWLSSRMVGGV